MFKWFWTLFSLGAPDKVLLASKFNAFILHSWIYSIHEVIKKRASENNFTAIKTLPENFEYGF